jgi:dTDP-4-dehydrorhamnose 3,5-epimerase
MQVDTFDIQGPLLFTPARHGDARGFFSETFRQDTFDAAVGPIVFVQDNHSRSTRRGVIRGLHYQAPPFAQGKLVRVTRGAVFDVAVDIRHGSPTFGRHITTELSEDNWRQLWIPPGFLHGFCTLTDDVEFLYKVTAYYSRAHDGGVSPTDPDLGIQWPLNGAEPLVSDKDAKAPPLKHLPKIFSL